MMHEARYVGRLEPGMDVCDADGNKFGSVGRVYRYATMMATAGSGDPDRGQTPPGEEILEVKTGLFGMGKHLYIPFIAIQDVTSSCVFINQPKDQVEQQGWDVKPDYLDELS